MANDKHLTTEEKRKVYALEQKRDRASARRQHVKVIETEREIREIFDGASDRQRD